jgi:hypothetical protein
MIISIVRVWNAMNNNILNGFSICVIKIRFLKEDTLIFSQPGKF